MQQGELLDGPGGPVGDYDDPISDALRSLDRALDQVAALDLSRPDTMGLMLIAQIVERQLNRLYLQAAHVAGEVDGRGLASELDAPSTRVLMRDLLNMAPADASARIRLDEGTRRRITPTGSSLPPRLAHLAERVPSGRIGPDHAAIITRTMEKLPAALHPDDRDACERLLVEQAQQLDPPTLQRLANKMLEAANPDGPEPAGDAHGRMELHVGRRRDDGLTRITGLLDDLAIEALLTAIGPLAAPAPAGTREPDPPTTPDVPAETDPPTTPDGPAATEPPSSSPPDPAPPPSDDRHHADPALKDPRSPATRRAHALGEVLSRYLKIGAGPRHGGQLPQIVVTVALHDLQEQLGRGRPGYTDALTAADVRLLACDAKILPVVLGGPSEVLDLGRARYTFSPAIRRAITVRDIGCSWPGCDRPGSWCEAHHVRWWIRDTGPTSLDNGALLCPEHHQQIHRGHWTMWIADDGTPEFIPPPWIDPDQRPRRNRLHRPAPTNTS
ncbi:HNH endonuclease signature motif containing protein [Nakamurella lactea]|uniref:HNH endonuclease signature motif containing protein n=1 Tax=Nakamurella lactea TaxID=459515 RepID=UPI0004910FA5|nr:HNH endonuclease signature motif containing protein [Nakamurella lactea]